MADATSSVDALVADDMDDMDDMDTSFDGYITTTHSHGHPEPSHSHVSASGSIAVHGHPSPEPIMKRPPPGFEPRPPVTSKQPPSAPTPAPLARLTAMQKPPTLADEEFPALGSPKLAKSAYSVPAAPKMTLPNTAIQGKHVTGKKPEIGSSPNDSRRGSLNDTEPGDATKTVAGTPRTRPKSIRVMAPARIEPPSIMSPMASRIMSTGQRPETPASETVSDSASIVSASVSASRAGSPPPSRVGSAAIRATTKSQQRKQRKEVLKQDTMAIAEAAVADEAEHAPLLGRKKKQKKEKPVKEKPVKEKPVAVPAPEAEASRKEEPRSAEQEAELAEGNSSQILEKIVLEPPRPQPPAPTAQDSAPEDDEPVTPPQGPSAVFEDIFKGLTTAIKHLSLLRPVASLTSIAAGQQSAACKPGACKEGGCKCSEIQSEDLAVLESGRPVHKQCRIDGTRMFISPYGDSIRNLTDAEEDRFLQLQDAVAQMGDSAGCFTAPRHQKSSGAFSIVKGRAVPNGRPNIFPITVRSEPQDPYGKLQRDEALGYINQYVLPSLNLGVGGKAVAASSGSPAPQRDVAAHSLNQLAPFFYGPEAAAGVGIYSAIDSTSARPVHDFGAPPGLTLGGNVDMVRGGTRGVATIALMDVEEAEAALATTRKDTEKLEKGLNAVIKRNRRLLIGD